MNYIWNVTTKRNEFFKRLKTLIHWKGTEKKIRKYIKKAGIKVNLLTVEYRYL
ncbi:MAG: hypothetical protein ACMUEL_00440 [Flavobacteriales bacterium Tduv]